MSPWPSKRHKNERLNSLPPILAYSRDRVLFSKDHCLCTIQKTRTNLHYHLIYTVITTEKNSDELRVLHQLLLNSKYYSINNKSGVIFVPSHTSFNFLFVLKTAKYHANNFSYDHFICVHYKNFCRLVSCIHKRSVKNQIHFAQIISLRLE